MVKATLPLLAIGAASGADVPLVTFDGASGTTHKFVALNDPVMGGQSNGTFSLGSGYAVFDGNVNIVPKLKAPGFIEAWANDGGYTDASAAAGGSLVLSVRTSTPAYDGYRVTFAAGSLSPTFACAAGGSIIGSSGCYKAKFSVPAGDDFSEVVIPFTSFSDHWSSETGEQTKTCAEDSSVCPTAKGLKKIQAIGVWGEGKQGHLHLEIKSISARPAQSAPLTAPSAAVELVTFDGAAATTHDFKELNDPVMGGQSNGTWSVGAGFGIFDGNVNIVPSLKAPGFIKASARTGTFTDASSAANGDLVLTVRSSTPEYAGFRVTIASGSLSPSFSCAAGGSIIGSGGCYKAKFKVPAGSSFTEVRIPFKEFSDHWSSATGEHTKECSNDSSVCITSKALSKIQTIELWGEGVLGKVHLEVKSIAAAPAAPLAATPSDTRPPKEYDTCSGHVQKNLRYNISSFTEPNVPVPVDATESLATAVCCDNRTTPFAEPRFLFESPFVNFFSKMNQTGITTFYDAVCGVPLFNVPIGRTLADFQADTTEHGWPSFRKEELVAANVYNDSNGFVYSSCGTHLGSYLPDDKGPRWCLDLSCVSGNPANL